MSRLTERTMDNVYYSKGKYPPATLCAEMETWEVRECMAKLAAYEDTGFEPEQVKQLNDAFKNSQKKLEKAFDDLLAYKDLEEQGLLIKLPCKIGDRVFSNHNPHSTKGDKVTQIKINRGGLHFKTWWGYFHISDIEKTVFLTREKAEKALKVEKENSKGNTKEDN